MGDLKNQVYDSIRISCEEKRVGVAFSGGVDSSLLAKACENLGMDVTLLTIGFEGSKDVGASEKTAKIMGLPLHIQIIDENCFEEELKAVLSIVGSTSLTGFENAVAFHYTAKLAKKHGFKSILSANGLDELYCGYHCYYEVYRVEGEEGVAHEIERRLEKARADKKIIDEVVKPFNVEKIDPFLTKEFIEYSILIPVREKIGGDGFNGKAIIRRLALEVGVPKVAALRPKKAFQYGSGIHKMLQKLARKKFSKEDVKRSMRTGRIELYIQDLIQRLSP